ncbi:MAG: heme A synthase [Chloroflexi bacterium]|nr:heme A synthase [Chloroflexota bacterium]
MNRHTTPVFRTLTVASAVTVFILMGVGGLVRVTGSGLGCPDWPLCYGQVLPPWALQTAWIEFSHRVVAGIAGLLILATSIVVWRNYRQHRALFVPSIVIVVMLVFQVPLGGVIVFTELEPLTVAIHLGKALIIFALAILIAVRAYRMAPDAADPVYVSTGYRTLLWGLLVGLYALLITGALVVGTQSSYACPDWPLCNGSLIPAADVNYRVLIQFGHRATVGVVSLLIVAAAVATLRRTNNAPGAKLWAVAMLVLLAGQIAVGAIQVLLVLPPFWRAMHLTMGSAVWGAAVVLTASSLAYRLPEALATRQQQPAATMGMASGK